MSDGLQTALAQLLRAGRCSASQLSARSQRALAPLFDSGVLDWQRQGRGAVVVALRPEAVRAFRDQRYPHAEEDVSGPPRAVAVARSRDAKRPRRTSAEPVLLRAFQPLVARRGADAVDLHALTGAAGAACLLLDGGQDWSMAGTLAVVENLECFLHCESLDVPADGALYAGGRLSERCLDWLASTPMDGCDWVHCGDFDPTGLAEYLRLQERLGARVRLHVPADVEELLATYGKPELLRKSAPLLAQLRSCPEPTVARIVRALDASGCGLEQEALLISIDRAAARR